MQKTITIEKRSILNSPAAKVWESISTMAGVNYELMPLVRMTYPKQAGDFLIDRAPTGQVLFRSVIFLFGFIPYDLHDLKLSRVDPGVGFLEESTTLVNRLWRHERTLEPVDDKTCAITDRLTVIPKLGFLAGLMKVSIDSIFRHRHKRLKRMFGRG